VRVIVFLHVVTMFTAVAAALGPAYLLQRISRNADVPTIRRSFALAGPIFKAIPIFFTTGAALGIVAIFTNGFDPFEPFLLIAYVLFVMATVVGITMDAPWERRVTQLAAESADEAPSPELTAALGDPRMKWVNWFDRLIILAFIFDMVVKPFS
jgi:hypothetical protein